MKSSAEGAASSWAQPGYFRGRSRLRNAGRLCWQLFHPPRGHRTRPTRTGVALILLALAVGTAAFNTAQNILYLGLSLLLGSLLVSGVMSWLNFAGCRWRLQTDLHGRVGESLPVSVELENTKRWLPTYGLGVAVVLGENSEPLWLYLEERLGPGRNTQLEALLHPTRRGRYVVRLRDLASAYPFGFLQKSIVDSTETEVLIWAPRIDYALKVSKSNSDRRPGSWRRRQGHGSELLNLRQYRPGDPMRTIHWKATARTGRMMVRETVDESSAEFVLVIESVRALWPEPMLDRLVALASTLAEDFFMAQRLGAVSINGEDPIPIRRLGDLHDVLSRLALLEPVDRLGPGDGLERWTPLRFRGRRERIDVLSGEEVVGGC